MSVSRFHLADMLCQVGLEGDQDAEHLAESELLALRNTKDLRQFTSQELPLSEVNGVDIVAFGSLARHEWTHQSDLDYLVIVSRHDLPPSQLRDVRAVARKCAELLEAPEPGQTGTFGSAVSAFELTSYLGLERDTNQTTTRRILVLEESVSLLNSRLHDELTKGIIARYLVEYGQPKLGVPRLLLNDVVRYWRTLAVDYQAKNWDRHSDAGWGLRYLKLRITRKLCFAGMLATLFLPVLSGTACDVRYLQEMVELPPLARLGRLFPYLNERGQEALRECLRTAGWFNVRLGDPGFRRMAAAVDMHEKAAVADGEFKDGMRRAGQLNEHLVEVFFEGNADLRNVSMKYGVF